MELLLGGLLLVFLGILIGTIWTIIATRSQISRQAKERRRLNEEWAAIRAVHRQQTECVRCASPLYEQNWYFAPIAIEERSDDDCAAGQRIS
jgi:uncharacterized protein YneF (UPF0154 family)